MKIRIGLTLWIFAVSLAALAAGAANLDIALGLYSPLDPTYLGPRVPAFTRSVIEAAPRYPLYMVVAAVVSVLVALYFWRSRRPTETKTFAVTLLAAVNIAIASFLPMTFYVAYFVLPKAANSV